MLSEIFVWIEKYGMGAAIFLFLAATVYGFYDQYLSYFFSSKLKREKRTKDENTREFIERRKDSLKDQEFFSNIHFKITVDISSETFSNNSTKSKMISDMLIILFKCYYDSMANFVKIVESDWDKNDWARFLNKEMLGAKERFRELARVEDIPSEAVDRFMLWYTPYMQQIYFYIRKIRGMGNRSSIENTNTFLLLLELILTNVMSDIQKRAAFNGTLDGIEYKGGIIGD
jgi:hypothetical protein